MDYFQKNVQYFMGQHYQATLDVCLESEAPFEDSYFPPSNDSVFLRKSSLAVEWKRLKEICGEPCFVNTTPSYSDIRSGEHGSSPFLAAASVLVAHQDFWNRVIPDALSQGKTLSEENSEQYGGVFRFRFWRLGSWYEVIVDDKLPTLNGLLYGVRSDRSDVFWCVLLEKAYAKLIGCYEAVNNMNSGCIIQDMTGCLLQDIPLAPAAANISAKKRLFKELCDSPQYGRITLTCWISPDEENPAGNETFLGLKVGHHYSVSAVKEIKPSGRLFSRAKSDKEELVKIRDPTGSKEWIGAWSHSSDEWTNVSEAEKKRTGLTILADGEFWMSFNDFCANFTDMSMCRIVPVGGVLRDQWREYLAHGQWYYSDDPSVNTAGGALEISKDSFTENPQYRFNISNETTGYVVIQLQQKEERCFRTMDSSPHHRIGIHLLKIEGNRLYRMHRFFDDDLVMISPHFSTRTSLMQAHLPKGRYVIIPTTHEPRTNAEFLLRVYAQAPLNFSELDCNYPMRSCWAFCVGYPQLVTRVRVSQGRNCLKPQGNSPGNVYMVIACEGQVIRSRIFKKNRDPEFDARAIFYRKKPDTSPILFTVYFNGLICDTFIGQGSVNATVDDTASSVEIPLFGRGKLAEKRYPGTLFVDITSSENVDAL